MTEEIRSELRDLIIKTDLRKNQSKLSLEEIDRVLKENKEHLKEVNEFIHRIRTAN